MKNNSKPKISVIMANYNKEKYLSNSINSVLNETYKNIELIVIDDGSTDDSKKIIEYYSKKDNRVIPVLNCKNFGPALARNIGLKVASGNYIAILDSDDIAMPERLETQYNFLERNPGIFLVGGGAIEIDENDKEININIPITEEIKLRKRLAKNNAIYHSSIMFRNEKCNYYREKFVYAGDYDFYLMLLSKGKRLINIPDILIKYRNYPDSILFNKNIQQELFDLKAKEFYQQRLKYGKDFYDDFDPSEILNLDVYS